MLCLWRDLSRMHGFSSPGANRFRNDDDGFMLLRISVWGETLYSFIACKRIRRRQQQQNRTASARENWVCNQILIYHSCLGATRSTLGVNNVEILFEIEIEKMRTDPLSIRCGELHTMVIKRNWKTGIKLVSSTAETVCGESIVKSSWHEWKIILAYSMSSSALSTDIKTQHNSVSRIAQHTASSILPYERARANTIPSVESERRDQKRDDKIIWNGNEVN